MFVQFVASLPAEFHVLLPNSLRNFIFLYKMAQDRSRKKKKVPRVRFELAASGPAQRYGQPSRTLYPLHYRRGKRARRKTAA